MMLFTPWRFAKQVRADEGFAFSLLVAVLSVVFACLAWSSNWRHWPIGARILLHVVGVILMQSFVFATLYWSRMAWCPKWRDRFRRWLIVSLYSTCFVATWSVIPPPYIEWIDVTNFYWPFRRASPFGGDPVVSLGTTIIFYWWWIILAAVLCVRTRPRWLGVLMVPTVFFYPVASANVIEACETVIEWAADVVRAVMRLW